MGRGEPTSGRPQGNTATEPSQAAETGKEDKAQKHLKQVRKRNSLPNESGRRKHENKIKTHED